MTKHGRKTHIKSEFPYIIHLSLLLVYWASAVSSTTKGNMVWYFAALVEIIPRSHRKIRHMAALSMTIPESAKVWCLLVSCLIPQKRRCEITIISFSRSICRGGLAALIGVTGKPYPSCLSCHSHPIRPFGAPSPRGEGCFYTSRHLDTSTQFSYFQISHFLTYDVFLRSGWRNASHHNLEPINLNPEPLIFYPFSKIEYTCKRYTSFLIYNNSSCLL